MSTAASSPARVLVVDDEPDLRTLYELTLVREGYAVESVGSVRDARASLEAAAYDVVISDMRLPDGLGLELLEDMQRRHRSERCIVMTAFGSADNAVAALKAGAFDYLTKPVDLKQFRAVVASAIEGAREASVRHPRQTGRPLASSAPEDTRGVRRLSGDSPAIRAVRERIAKVSRSMAPVLIQGESGTGKELVARAIHEASHRHAGPFIAVNCGAIPENLIEAEFFGASKGAYTGSTQDRDGYFRAAQGGTLFLDEIGDLPVPMQPKLLRAIQERVVRPLGSTQEVAVDVRILSATHRDLGELVSQGRFRQDLFFRLNVIELRLPALRERREDLPALCDALLAKIASDHGLDHPPPLSRQALDRLQRHPLEGNVRELENILHRAIALSDGDELDFHAPDDLAPQTPTPGGLASADDPLPEDLQAWLDDREREVLLRALKACDYNRTAAAARLGLSLRQIRYRIARLGIGSPDGTEGDGA